MGESLTRLRMLRGPDGAGLACLGAAWAAILAFLVVEVYDLDVWFHLAIGRDILASGEVPTVERYAVAALGRPYHDSHWLFQVAIALAQRAAGWVGVQLVAILLWAGALGCGYSAARRHVGRSAASVLLFLSGMACVERFLPRPEVVTVALVGFFWWRLQDGRFVAWRDLLLLAGLQALWTNSHGLFVLGPGLAACYAVAEWLTAAPERAARRPATRLFAILLCATLVSPDGLGSWRYAALLFGEVGSGAPAVMKSLGELSPTFGAAARSAPAFWFHAALAAAIAVLAPLALARRQLAVARGLAVTGLFGLSLLGRRNVVLLAVVAAPVLAECLASTAARLRWPRASAPLAAMTMLAWAAFPFSGRYFLWMEIPARVGWGVTPSFFPHALPDWLARTQGQVLNSNTLGGFLLFHGGPNRLPLTDGRWEIYEPATLDLVLGGSRDPARWPELLARYSIRALLLQHASPEARALLPSLARDTGWKLVAWDHAASFWARSDGSPPAVSLKLPPAPPRADDCLMLDLFLRDVGATALRAKNLQRALAFGWLAEGLLERLGSVEVELQDWSAAEQSYRRLLTLRPRHVQAMNELAFLVYRRGERGEARALLSRALEIEPSSAGLRANLRGLEGPADASPEPGIR